MKKIFSILSTLLVVVLGLGLGACQKDKYEVEEDTFKVLASEISDSKSASVGSIQVSEGDFKFEASAPWVTLRLKDATNLELSISENTSGEMRTCLITLSKGTTRINVPVHQMGRISIIKDFENFSLARVGGERSFMIESQEPVTVSYDVDWLSHKIEGDKLIFTAQASSLTQRRAKATVKTGLFSREITITQEFGYEDIPGEYTLSFLPWNNQARTEVNARIVKVGDGYELQGAATPIPLEIDPQSLVVNVLLGHRPNPGDVPSGEQLTIAAWGAGFPNEAGELVWRLYLPGEAEATYIGTWSNTNTLTPKVSFRSGKDKGLARAIAIYRSPGFKGWYAGANNINSIIDPILTKKSN